MLADKKIGIIGIGNMGGAILDGIIAGGVTPAQVYVLDKDNARVAQAVARGVQEAQSVKDLASKCDVIILAVKPGQIVPAIQEAYNPNRPPLFISVAAGVTIADMEAGHTARIIRTMPNTPAVVGEAMTAICAGSGVSNAELELACNIFGLFGKTAAVDESLLEAVAGISGCSPAYVYMFIEALADAAVLHGMPRKDSYTFAAQAVLGAAKMVLETGHHPGALKDAVCSPGGATIEAVAELERQGFRGAVIDAVDAAVCKAIAMKS